MNFLLCLLCQNPFESESYFAVRKQYGTERAENGTKRYIHVGWESPLVCPAVCPNCGGKPRPDAQAEVGQKPCVPGCKLCEKKER